MTWCRRGNRGEALDPKRSRRLLRSDKVPLVTWSYGEMAWVEGKVEKQRASDELHQLGGSRAVFTTEWKSDEGEHLLMLEHHG